jgi:hypothetical protein
MITIDDFGARSIIHYMLYCWLLNLVADVKVTQHHVQSLYSPNGMTHLCQYQPTTVIIQFFMHLHYGSIMS